MNSKKKKIKLENITEEHITFLCLCGYFSMQRRFKKWLLDPRLNHHYIVLPNQWSSPVFFNEKDAWRSALNHYRRSLSE